MDISPDARICSCTPPRVGGRPSGGSPGRSSKSALRGARITACAVTRSDAAAARNRRGLLADPHLLILDEPMNGLDPAGVLDFRALVRAFVDEGRTVVLSSDLLDEVERTCDEAAILAGGVTRRAGIARPRSGGILLEIECDDAGRALGAPPDSARCRSERLGGDGIRIELAPGARAAAIRVRSCSPGSRCSGGGAGHTLEERFLALTSTTGEDDEARSLPALLTSSPTPRTDDPGRPAGDRRPARDRGHPRLVLHARWT